MEKGNTFVGMDVHKESIDIAIADGGRDGEVHLADVNYTSPTATNRLPHRQSFSLACVFSGLFSSIFCFLAFTP